MMTAVRRWGPEWTIQKTRVHVCGRGFGTVTDSAVTEHRPPLGTIFVTPRKWFWGLAPSSTPLPDGPVS
jgi:hypothetical protein